jgi:hypothetical protein
LHPAHGTAADGGAVLVAEAVGLREMKPGNAARTEQGIARHRQRGRVGALGNTAAAGRQPSLTRVAPQPDAPEERRRVRRKAASLAAWRRRELEEQAGGPVSSHVRVELVAWALATSWADHHDAGGDEVKAAAFREKASSHGLKALGIAEREAAGRPVESSIERLRASFAGGKP